MWARLPRSARPVTAHRRTGRARRRARSGRGPNLERAVPSPPEAPLGAPAAYASWPGRWVRAPRSLRVRAAGTTSGVAGGDVARRLRSLGHRMPDKVRAARPSPYRPAVRTFRARLLPAVEVGVRHVGELAAPMGEAARRAPRGTVGQLERHLGDGQAGADRVDGHPELHPEALREGQQPADGLAADRALAGDRRLQRQAGERADGPGREPPGQAKAPAHA